MLVSLAASCGGSDDPAPVDAPTDAPAVDAATTDGPIDANMGLNGCMRASAVDLTDTNAVRTISMVPPEAGQYVYTPPCIVVAAGQSVTIEGDVDNTFVFHPLRAGTVTGSNLIPDPSSPIPSVSSGMTTTFTMPNVGVFPYYCSTHGLGFNMMGVIYVE